MSNTEVVFSDDSTQSICDGSPDAVDRALAPAVPASGAIRFSYQAIARAIATRSASGLVTLAMIFRSGGVVLGPKRNHRAKLASEAVANDHPIDRRVWKRRRRELTGNLRGPKIRWGLGHRDKRHDC